MVLPARPGRRAPAGGRLPVRADARERRPLDGLRGRVRLDRGAGRRRLRPPADRHLAAVAAAPGAARPRVLGRAAWPTAPAGRGWPASPRRSAAPRTSSTGRRSGPSFDRLADLFAQVGRGDHAGPDGRRRPRSACCPATCTTPTPRRPHYREPLTSQGLPADLLPAAQLRARLHEGRPSASRGTGLTERSVRFVLGPGVQGPAHDGWSGTACAVPSSATRSRP